MYQKACSYYLFIFYLDYSEHRETLMGLVENGTADFEETVEWDNLKVTANKK